MKNKNGEWLLVDDADIMSIQPMFRCSECNDIISTYDPPKICRNCGSHNERKGNSTSDNETLDTLRSIMEFCLRKKA